MTERYEDAVAIVGMSGRFPGSATVEELWDRITTGESAIRRLSEDELAAVDPARRQAPGFVPVAATVDDVDLWDANFFGLTPRAAELSDPQHKLFMECCWEAMERAGYDPTGQSDVVGVLGGCGWPGYLLNNIATHRSLVEESGHLNLVTGNDREGLVAMVAYKLNLRGPSGAVQTSCSTSMTAVHLACQSLLSFESDMMLAGGAAIGTPQAEGYVYEEGGIVSAEGVCRSLDASSDGGVFGNAVAVLLLKRAEDAIADGDQIFGVIRGSAANNDGSARAGYAAPGLRGQAEVMAEAMANADVSPAEISYIEAHGTGTALGDSIELDAISRNFMPRDPQADPCTIGSIKPITGHTDRASGALGLIKTALMMRHEVLPGQINFSTPNPSLDTGGGALRVNTELSDWQVSRGPRTALVNSFGLGGTNVSLVLQEPPPVQARQPVADPQILVLAARTPSALDTMTGNLREHLAGHPELDLADVAYTLQTGRSPFNHRRTVVAADLPDAVSALGRGVPSVEQPHRMRSVTLVVPESPGELAACRSLAAGLHESEPVFRAAFEECAAAFGAAGEAVWQDEQAFAKAFPYALGVQLQELGLRPDRCAGIGAGAAVAACLDGAAELGGLDTAAGSGHATDPAELSADSGVLVELGTGALLHALGAHPADAEGTRFAVVGSPDRGGERAALRELVAGLWLAGVEIDWPAAHQARAPRKLLLPTYPFERQRYWIEPNTSTTVAEPEQRRHEDIAGWFYAPVWRQAPRVVPGGLDGQLAEAGPWLIVGDGCALTEQLRERLVTAGAQVRVAGLSGERDGLAGQRPRTVLHLGPASEFGQDGAAASRVTSDGAASDVPASVPGFDSAQRAGFYSTQRLVASLAGQSGTDGVNIVLFTRGATKITDDEQLRPEAAGLAGLARVIPQENPGLSCRVVDVDEQTTKQIEVLLNEALDDDPTAVAYRDEARWRQEYEQLNVPTGTGASPPFQHRGTYLISGGLGQISLAIGKHLAAQHQARLALLTRTPLPPEEHWDDWLATHDEADTTSRRIRAVRAMQQDGAEVLIVVADIGDPAQVADAVHEVQAHFGDLRGVIHAAGVQAEEYFGLIQDLGAEQIREHYRAKLFGLAALAEAVDLDRLDFCVTLSSLATVLGALGHAPYAAANAAMDAYALDLFCNGKRRVMSVNWDSWPSGKSDVDVGPTGVTVDKYRMSYDEGVEALTRALGLVGVLPRLVSSTGDLGPRMQAWVSMREDGGGNEWASHARPPLAVPFVEPADDVEQAVASVWTKVMGLTEVGAIDDFFELGGHSLLAVQLIGGIRKSLRCNIPIGALSECPTVRSLADKVKSINAEQAAEARSAPAAVGGT